MKSSDTAATSNAKSSGLQLGSSSGVLQLGTGGGLQLGTGGFLPSGGIKLGIPPTNVQPTSGESIAGNPESTSATDNLEGIKIPLVGQKRSSTHTEDTNSGSHTEPFIGSKNLVGDTKGLPFLNKSAVNTPKSVTFKLDSDNKSSGTGFNNNQSSANIAQPSLVGSSVLTSSGLTVGGDSSISGDVSKFPVASDTSSVKPFANLFPKSLTTNSIALPNFASAKSTSAPSLVMTTASTLFNAPLLFNAGVSSSSTTTSVTFNFSQQPLFTTPGNSQQASSGGLNIKLPTCQEKKEISSNITFNFSGVKSNELSQSQQQGWWGMVLVCVRLLSCN